MLHSRRSQIDLENYEIMTRVMFPPCGLKAGEPPFWAPSSIHPSIHTVFIPFRQTCMLLQVLKGMLKVGMWPLLVYDRSSPL